MPDPTPPEPVAGDPMSLPDRAVALAERWLRAEADAPADPAAVRLAGVLGDPDGLTFTVGFVDGVIRPDSAVAAAAQLRRIAPIVPDFLPWYLRGAVRAGGALAPLLPLPVVPIARRALREMVGHLVVDARPARLGPVLDRLRASGARLNINLLGEAVLGEREADRRLDGILELIRRPDVDYVSVKVSGVVSRISLWGFDEVVDDVVARLLPLYLSARENHTFVNLDMEEYRDLDLTIAVFTRVLEHPDLLELEAGIVLQAYLPDAFTALQQLTAWSRQRVSDGGAPIKIRLVKGANLAMERVDAVMHGWAAAPYDAKTDTDANYLRCLEWALTPDHVAAVRVGVAGHNLYHLAYAWELAGDRGVRDRVDVEMLLGMAQDQAAAVARDVGPVLLYVPVVAPAEFDAAIGYLVRRLEEAAGPENFLSVAHRLAEDAAARERERARFLAAVTRSHEPSLRSTPRRTQDRGRPDGDGPPLLREPPPVAGEALGLTQAVLGIAASRQSDPVADAVTFGGAEFVETAVYSARESAGPVSGASGFRNAPDTDMALAANRVWARSVREGISASTAGDALVSASRISGRDELDALVRSVREAGGPWGALPASDRAAILLAASRVLESRRALLLEVAASETGKTLAEADTEVSEAVDFARYYAATGRELDGVAGAVFLPEAATVVAPPWNFPVSIPAGGVIAALAAGSGVIFKPSPQAVRCGAVIAEALWDAGVPRDLLRLAVLDEDALGRDLIAHPGVDRVILTGSFETARTFRTWRPDLPLVAETSGKNAIVVTPTADADLAAAAIVASAFSHAGQKCSAASLAILVGPVARSARFARQLLDATRSLRVGPPTDPRAEVPPLIEPPRGKLAWALTTLGDGEEWLIRPESVPDPAGYAGRLWRPGIRTGVRPGSRFHQEEFFGPVLGIMQADTLDEAIELQNQVPYGLTAGLFTQHAPDLERWLDRVQAGNLYVNRAITGAVVQRQPFGGWKRSSAGPGAKTGGPHYLVGLGRWRPTEPAGGSPTLHLRGLDSRITAIVEASQPSLDYERFEWLRRAALSDAVEWDREFGRVKDAARLGVERNLTRYRPVPVVVRATAGAALRDLLRVAIAGLRSGSRFVISSADRLPPAVRRAFGDAGVTVFVEDDTEWLDRFVGGGDALPAVQGRPRIRLIGEDAERDALRRSLADRTAGDPELAVYAGAVTTAGRLELLPFLHEQAISITAHRFGTPDDWSEAVI